MDYVPTIFAEAPLGAPTASPCSPQMAPDARGIAVQAPEKVVLKGEMPAVVPLCGAFQMTALQTVDAPPMVIHVRRQSDGVVQRGMLAVDPEGDNEPDMPPPADVPPIPPAVLANTLVSGWFHLDAQAWLDLPLIPGAYEFAVSWGGETSPVVTVEIAP